MWDMDFRMLLAACPPGSLITLTYTQRGVDVGHGLQDVASDLPAWRLVTLTYTQRGVDVGHGLQDVASDLPAWRLVTLYYIIYTHRHTDAGAPEPCLTCTLLEEEHRVHISYHIYSYDMYNLYYV
jgi:hypothetical protein